MRWQAVSVNLNPSTDTAVRIGYANWTAEKIAENADAVATALVDRYVEKKWSNVRSVYIKGQSTAAVCPRTSPSNAPKLED
jgi:ribosome biogenesis protein UTP30